MWFHIRVRIWTSSAKSTELIQHHGWCPQLRWCHAPRTTHQHYTPSVDADADCTEPVLWLSSKNSLRQNVQKDAFQRPWCSPEKHCCIKRHLKFIKSLGTAFVLVREDLCFRFQPWFYQQLHSPGVLWDISRVWSKGSKGISVIYYAIIDPLKSSNFASFLRLVPMFQPSLEPWAPWEHRKRRKRAVWEVPWICVQSLNGGTEGPKNWKPRKFPDQLWNILQVFLDIPGMIDPKTSMKSFRPNFVGFNFQFLWLPGIVDRGSWGKCAYLVSLSSRHLTAKRERFHICLKSFHIPTGLHGRRLVWQSYDFDLIDRSNTHWTFGFCEVHFATLELLIFGDVRMYYVSLASQWCIQYPVARCLCNNQIFLEKNTSYIATSILHVISSSSFETLQPFVDWHSSQPFKSPKKKTQFNWVQREIAEKSQHGNCVAWWHISVVVSLPKDLKTEDSHGGYLRWLPSHWECYHGEWGKRTFLLLRCKAKLPRDFPYKICLHDNFVSNAFRLSVFCEVPAMSPESGQRRIASTTKVDDRNLSSKTAATMSYPSLPLSTVSWKHHETTSILRFPWWKAS